MKVKCSKCNLEAEAEVRPDPKHPNFPDLHCANCGEYVYSALGML